jgi:hypothetical protein
MNPCEVPNVIILDEFWSRVLEAVKRAAEAQPCRVIDAAPANQEQLTNRNGEPVDEGAFRTRIVTTPMAGTISEGFFERRRRDMWPRRESTLQVSNATGDPTVLLMPRDNRDAASGGCRMRERVRLG